MKRNVLAIAFTCVIAIHHGQSQAQVAIPNQKSQERPQLKSILKAEEGISSGSSIQAKPASTSSPVDATPEKGKYLLRYKLIQGQLLHSEVTHLAKTDTRIEKVDQSSQSRTISQKVWEVISVEPNGNMTFINRIDSVDLSQQLGQEPEIRYDSTSPLEPPALYAKVAESIGKPISKVTINPRGEVVHREEGKSTPSMGMGDITLVMPADAVAIGAEWNVPREIRIRNPEGGQQAIKILEQYELQKVSAGVATIAVRSVPITPISEPSVESQVVQQLSNGVIKFDIDAGRMISKELNWDESIVGFSGSGSMMEYSARFHEEFKKVSMAPKTALPNKLEQRR